MGKAIRKPKLARPYNHGTMTSSMFFSMIRSALRARSRWWKPIAECKKKAKRVYKGTNKRQKFEYQCNECKNWFPEKEVAVDHIVPVGELNKFEDLAGFTKRLFVEVDELQVLCSKDTNDRKSCHTIKTNKEREILKKKR